MTDNRFEKRKAITRGHIQEAFIELIHEKNYEDITVREISERAGIGFKTYYRHYDDKTSLVLAIINTLWLDIVGKLEPPLTLEATVRNAGQVLAYVKAHATLVRAISRTPLLDMMLEQIYETGIADALRFQISALDGENDYDDKIRNMVAFHFVKSQFSLIIWWIENDLVIPIEDMEGMIEHLIMQPIWNLPKSLVKSNNSTDL